MIPYGRHNIDQADIDAVIDVLKSDWLTCGPVVDRFEDELSKTVGAKFSISCSNGTTALHLALLALDIKNDDVVLVPAVTFLATANAVRYVNADIVFVDVDPNTGLMTAKTLEEAILKNKHRNLKALINVHLAGQCDNLEKIFKVARDHNLLIIEDAAHAIGTIYVSEDNSKHYIGSNDYCDITTFSFHPVKTIAMGEGGAITTNDLNIANKVKSFRSHGMIRDENKWINEHERTGPWYYEMHDLGYNYRLSDINCALGLSQLLKLSDFKTKRAELVKVYDYLFLGLENLQPLKRNIFSDTSWHLYVLLIDFDFLGATRKDLMIKLKTYGIGTQVQYIPVYKQPYYKKLYGEIKLSGAEEYYNRCLSIPLYNGLSENEIQKISTTLKMILC